MASFELELISKLRITNCPLVASFELELISKLRIATGPLVASFELELISISSFAYFVSTDFLEYVTNSIANISAMVNATIKCEYALELPLNCAF